jgi:hypothetical protein
MKTRPVRTVIALVALCVLAGTAGCSRLFGPPDPGPGPSVRAPESLRAAADEVLRALESRDGQAFAAVVHPTKGVRFSPYAYVDVLEDVQLAREEIAAFWTDTTVRRWGSFDGTGDPIEMTASEYYSRFILDRDFSSASSVNTNSDRAAGNTMNNVLEAYPDAVRVEYYIEPTLVGDEPGNDWAALRLVFELDDDRYFLVGIIHDEWTI